MCLLVVVGLMEAEFMVPRFTSFSHSLPFESETPPATELFQFALPFIFLKRNKTDCWQLELLWLLFFRCYFKFNISVELLIVRVGVCQVRSISNRD